MQKAGKNFIIFFDEKEGSTPIISLLSNFTQISVVHVNGSRKRGWEPFDSYHCGSLSLSKLQACIAHVFNQHPAMDQLNAIYTQSARKSLDPIDGTKAVGFKMRFKAPVDVPFVREGHPVRSRTFFYAIRYLVKMLYQRPFRKMMIKEIEEHQLVVFFTMRKDLLRWALSRYHGDGTGSLGHLQFKMARGAIDGSQVPKIHVNPLRLRLLMFWCRRQYRFKEHMLRMLRNRGVQAYPLIYEDFVADPFTFFSDIFNKLGISLSEEAYQAAIARGTSFKKVHDHAISSFVRNHEEILRRFGSQGKADVTPQ